MAVESVSLSRDNSLEELRVVIEEKKGEVKRKFTEVKKLLEISENTTTNRLDRIYTDVREGVERSERTVTQLGQAKIALNAAPVDNDTTFFLQSTNQNIDDQIAKARNSACVVPKHISLRWSIEELKLSIENVCEVISSSTVKGPKPEASSQSMTSRQTANEIASYQTEIRTLQTKLAEEREKFLQKKEMFKQELAKLGNQNVEKDKIISFKNETIISLEIELGRYSEKLEGMMDQLGEGRSKYEGFDKEQEGVRKELEQRTKELVSLQKENLQMQEKYQNEIFILTQQSNPTKVQSKRDSQTGTVVKEKQTQYSQVVSKHKQQQPEYTTTKLYVNGKSSQFYTLNQVDNPSDLVGELVVCRSTKWKSEYVIGTLKVVILTKLRYDKAMTGIEFTDKFGDSTGSYLGKSYFKTNYNCALFIPTTEVYISYNESPK